MTDVIRYVNYFNHKEHPSKKKSLVIQTVEMHTGGEALRVVVDGYPFIQGKTILDKRRYVKEKCDYIRKMLILEPRGSDAMYGAIIIEKDIPEADMAVLFMHGEGILSNL